MQKSISTLDEVAIWVRALNESEIQDRFQQDGISYEFVLANASNFNVSNITAIRFAINNYTRQYWDEYTVFVENFDSVARIEANNGTIVGNFSICEGRFGNGGCFDGNSGYIGYGDGPNGVYDMGTDDFTVETWIKTSSLSTQIVLQKGAYTGGSGHPGYRFYINSAGTLQLQLGNSRTLFVNTGIGSGFNDGYWHHIAWSVDRDGSYVLYKDGASVASSSISNNASDSISTTYDLYIGANADESAGYFDGTIDEVRITRGIARRPVSALWTLNYTLASTEAMHSDYRHYWKVRALDQGGEQG